MTELPLFVRRGACIPRLPSRVETLVPAQPPTVDLDDVKNERSLFVVAGGVSDFLERDGTRYVVLQDASTTFAEAGVALPDCAAADTRGCVDRGGPNPIARLKDGLSLSFPGGSLTIDTTVRRQIDVEVLVR
jgi:hypothetical protein